MQPRLSLDQASQVDERWSMDFVTDQLVDGRYFRVFTVVDEFSRECVALHAAISIRSKDVGEVLDDAIRRRSAPAAITCDNGTEFTSKALDAWAYWNKVKLDFSRRGKPGDNAHIEAFNSLVRRECLSQHWFTTLEEARGILETWKEEYNNDRPHGSLQQMTPARYRAGVITAEDRNQPETRTSGGSEKG